MANRPTGIKGHDERGEGFSLKRWSRRKLDAARTATPPETAPGTEPRAQVAAPAAPSPDGMRPVTANAPSPAAPETLPNVESLSFDSDFTGFLRPEVDETLKRKALAKLFRDPRFNVMDGLDVYIDDYSKPDPIPAEMLRQLVHCRSIFDPPRTRVNAQGFVEDIPPEELAAEARADATAIEDTPAIASEPAAPDDRVAPEGEPIAKPEPAAAPAPTRANEVSAQPRKPKQKPSAA